MTIPQLRPSAEIFHLIWLIKRDWSSRALESWLPACRLFLLSQLLIFCSFSRQEAKRHMRLVACCSARLIYCLEYHTPVTFHLFVSWDNFLSFCALIRKRCHRHLSERSVEWVIVLLATEHAQVMFSDRRRRVASHNRAQTRVLSGWLTIAPGHIFISTRGRPNRRGLDGLLPHYARLLETWWGVLHFKLLDAE